MGSVPAHGFSLPQERIAAAKILVVDDDALVTSSLRSFLSLELDLDPLVFNDSRQALDYLRENQVDLVISDFLMPEVDGIKLLTEARRLHPEAPRVLLTGYADKQSAIRAINEAQLYQYIEKPWQNENLKEIVYNGLERSHFVKTLFSHLAELSPQSQSQDDDFRRSLARALA